MSGRAIAQIVIAGTQIIGRAFVEAYKVAASEAAKQSSKAALKSDADAVTKKTGITIEEACQILNVDQKDSAEKVLERYETLFKLNEPEKGGSFYLQSKIYRAKERFDLELKKNEEPLEEVTKEESKDTTPKQN